MIVLPKLMRQEKGYSAKKFIAEYPSKLWTMSALNKILRKINTDGHFGVTS